MSVDFDGTLMRNPYWSLHLKPWLLTQAGFGHKSWQKLWETMAEESEHRLRHRNFQGAYDWQDIASKTLHMSLPNPNPPRREDLIPLVYPDVWDFLLWATGKRLTLHIVTNGLIKNQWPYLRALGWDKIFTSWIGADSGFAKPDPRPFRLITGLSAHIGDRLAHDVLGAKRASILAVHLKRPGNQEDKRGWDALSPSFCQADLTVKSLQELPERLTQILPTIQHEGQVGYERYSHRWQTLRP